MNHTPTHLESKSKTAKPSEPFFSPTIQKKLSVGSANDAYEVEADNMADRVMRMPEPTPHYTTQTGALIQRKCSACEQEEKLQMKPLADSITPLIQRSSHGESGGHAPSHIEGQINGSKGGGSYMDHSTQHFMESRFGTDFSDVKIHTGSQAVLMSRELNAEAFTVGNDIYFNEGKYSPNSDNGKHLLAHELTHTVQQSNNHLLRKRIQRQTVRLNSGRTVGDTRIDSSNLKEDVMDVMDSLHTLWGLNNTNYAVEYPTVSRRAAMRQVPVASIPHTIAAITANEQPVLNSTVANGVFSIGLSGNVGRSQSNTKSDILLLQDYLHSRWFLTTANYGTEHAAVNAGPNPVNEASIPNTLVGISTMKISKVAEGFRRHDMLTGTRPITSTMRANVERELIPGATSTGSTVTVPTPDAICATVPALETEIRTNIVPYVHSTAAAFNTRRLSPAVLPIAQMNSMADIVQQEFENYFGNYLRAATVSSLSTYLPGTYRVRSQLRDQSTTAIWQTTPGRVSWINYWISTRLGNSHHCDAATLDTVANNIATDAALIPDIDITVQSWPAEATNGINMNPYLADATANTDEIRRVRWEAFTIILHEAMHHLAHPNFQAAYGQMNDDSKQILKEGFNDMFRHELWFGAGNLQSRIASTAYNANRGVIEGAIYPFNSAVVDYHGDYPEILQATNIRGIIGDQNAKAAYFLGHTELLGLGSGSHGLTTSGSFSSISSYHTSDRTENNRVRTLPGETLAALRIRLNAASNTVRNVATGATISNGSATLPSVVSVTGITHVTIITGDTISSIAYQNGVSNYDIIRANNLTSYTLTVGNRLIIPIH